MLSFVRCVKTISILLLALGLTMPTWADELVDSLDTTIPTQNVDEVVVTGARYSTTARELPMTVSIISRQTLLDAQSPTILPTLMQHIPSFMLTQRGVMGYGVSGGAAGGINVRGLGSGTGQVLVLIDGEPQYQGIFGHSIADSYQTLMAERVEVVRGPASVLYGSNAMGGVINIVTRQQRDNGVHAHINLGAGMYNTFQGEGNLGLRFGRFSSTIAAQYSRSDNHRERMGFEQYGGLVKLGYEITDNWRLSAMADVTHFNASNPGSVTDPLFEADQSVTRGVASLSLSNGYDQANGRLAVYDNFGFHTINDGYREGQPPQTELFRSQDHLIGVSAYETLTLFRGSYITLGFDYQHIIGHAWYVDRETGETVLGSRAIQSVNESVDEYAGYIDVRQDFTDWISLNVGVRYDHHSIAGGQWIPEAAIVTHPTSNSELKAHASRGFRNPTLKDLYLYKPANHDSLRAESIWNYELSWRQSFQSVTYGANIYFLHGDNMIQTVAMRNVNTGKIQNLGVEAELAWQVDEHWLLTTNHSYIHMWHPVVATPTYKGYLGAEMQYGKWKATAGLQQLVGLYTAVGNAPQKTNATLLNMTISYQPWRQFGIWVRGDNLLAQRYELNAGYPMPRATVMAGINVNF